MEYQGIFVRCGNDLMNKDWFGHSDPYFICRFGTSGSSWEQKSIDTKGLQYQCQFQNNTENPTWNEIILFPKSDYFVKDKVLETTLRVYDYDYCKTDDFLGEVTIQIPKTGKVQEASYSLEGKGVTHGNIIVELFMHVMVPCIPSEVENPRFWQIKNNMTEVLDLCEKSYKKGKLLSYFP